MDPQQIIIELRAISSDPETPPHVAMVAREARLLIAFFTRQPEFREN